MNLTALASTYFEVWNAHDVAGLEGLLAVDATLRDWDISKSGGKEVAEANGGIFKAVPKIAIEVLQYHVSEATSTVSCEILVKLNNATAENPTGDVLKVVDIITYDAEGKIKSVRAYKG
jgi:hypothetical protein